MSFLGCKVKESKMERRIRPCRDYYKAVVIIKHGIHKECTICIASNSSQVLLHNMVNGKYNFFFIIQIYITILISKQFLTINKIYHILIYCIKKTQRYNRVLKQILTVKRTYNFMYSP